MTTFLCVWTNDNPSTYVETCPDEATLKRFLCELREEAGEYPQYIIRGSDLEVASVRGKHGDWTYQFPLVGGMVRS